MLQYQEILPFVQKVMHGMTFLLISRVSISVEVPDILSVFTTKYLHMLLINGASRVRDQRSDTDSQNMQGIRQILITATHSLNIDQQLLLKLSAELLSVWRAYKIGVRRLEWSDKFSFVRRLLVLVLNNNAAICCQ